MTRGKSGTQARLRRCFDRWTNHVFEVEGGGQNSPGPGMVGPDFRLARSRNWRADLAGADLGTFESRRGGNGCRASVQSGAQENEALRRLIDCVLSRREERGGKLDPGLE